MKYRDKTNAGDGRQEIEHTADSGKPKTDASSPFMSFVPSLLPAIHMKSLLKRLGGNRTLLAELLCDLARDYGSADQEIQNALTSNHWERAGRLAHTIKGVAANLSATPLKEAAAHLETGIKERRENDIPSLLGRFRQALVQVLESVATISRAGEQSVEPSREDETTERTSPGAETTRLDFSKVSPILMELANLLERNSLEAERCLNSLKPYLGAPRFHESMKRLEDQMNRLDFQNARRTLAGIALELYNAAEMREA